ncbi:MAG: hypothetical protein LBQ56_02820 [Synergistaceae bacterium]|nr:hypothetical protein [Synergistaceae bacterium]
MRWNLLIKPTLAAIILVLFSGGGALAADLAAPAVDREAAEESFLRGYDYFLANRLWDSLDSIERAQEQNIYFVDAYFLRSLALRRLGRYPEAIAAMTAYLEVRRDEYRGSLILDAMQREWNIIGRTLGSSEIETELFFRSHTLGSLLGVPITSRVSFAGMLGLGKISACGSDILVCDTLGDRLWVFDRDRARPVMSSEFERPVAALPLAPSDAMVLLKSGDVLRTRIEATSGTIGSSLMGSVEANVADAAMIDSTLMAVADRTGQSVRFCRIPSLEEAAEWRPDDSEDTEKLFEPVALAVNGPFIAIADRGNGRVFVLDSYTLAVQDRFDVERPRDLDWGIQGELYVLSEEGTLHLRYPLGGESSSTTQVVSGMKEAWSIVWSSMGPVITDIVGRAWWSSRISPSHTSTIGAIALHSPWIEERDGTETLMLRGAASSLYHDFIQGKVPITEVVWRDEVRPSRILEVAASSGGEAAFYSPFELSGPPGASRPRVTRAYTIDDVMADLAGISRSGGEIPRVIVFDTRIAATDAQLMSLMGFLLHQGMRLDLWILGRPASVLLSHISRITLGYSYFTETPGAIPFNESVEWVLSLPLPPDTATFGYPSEVTLSIFSNIDMISFTDWLPIWPSLMDRRRGD